MKKKQPRDRSVKAVYPSTLSEGFGSFGDLENFVNVIGEDCDEVRPRAPGHVGAERGFTHMLRVLHVPDLWHTAARPGGGRKAESKTGSGESMSHNSRGKRLLMSHTHTKIYNCPG